jgi:hypothetical protein
MAQNTGDELPLPMAGVVPSAAGIPSRQSQLNTKNLLLVARTTVAPFETSNSNNDAGNNSSNSSSSTSARRKSRFSDIIRSVAAMQKQTPSPSPIGHLVAQVQQDQRQSTTATGAATGAAAAPKVAGVGAYVPQPPEKKKDSWAALLTKIRHPSAVDGELGNLSSKAMCD